ncbi:MAG: EAL domain-containing protein [Lachnospiraceae bacterium]|nr:EAL domain-containing protein [Lachnospiraceae bacterium]
MRLDNSERKKMLTIFAKNLPFYRKSMKLSQEEFGETIGITRQTVSSIERGAYPLTWAIFLSCLFICTGQPRARKLILNSYSGEPVLLGFLNELIGDKGTVSAENTRGAARQIYYGTCTVMDDKDYSIVDCDSGVCEMLGVSDASKAGTYLEHVFFDDREAIRRILDEKIRKQMVVCIEHRLISAEGRAIPVQCFVRRQKKMMKNGLFDITITQVTGEMLRKRQVSGLLEMLPVGVAVFEYQGRIARENVPDIVYANDVFYDIIGHTKEQFSQIHDNFLPAVVAPDDKRMAMRLFDAKNETDSVTVAEFRLNRFDGSVAWVHCNALVVWRSEQEDSTLLSCVFTDITQRINAEMSMKHQLDRYRQLEDVSDDIQFGYDVIEDRLSVPTRLSEQLGREGVIPNVLATNLPSEFCHPEDYDAFMQIYRNAVGGENGKGEFRIKFDGKEYKWCKLNMIGIKDSDGTVIYIYGRLTVIDEERRRQKERTNDRMIINRLNSTDRLTNLYNRTAFRGRVQEVLGDPEMDPVHAIIYCDINDFSYINEKYGYPAGDRILRDFGSMFLRKGKKCFACRIHSDYFLIYVNGETEEQVLAKVRSWSKVFVEHQTKMYPGIDIQLTSGVYFLRRGEHDIALAMDNANLARKQAKTENSLYCICTEELRAKRSYEQTIAGEIQNAIRDNKIEVFLLPKFSLEGRRVIGAEALARWCNDDGTYRSPADFIPILEKTGHITDLDFCIYTNVLQTLRSWKNKGIPMVPISVNFSKNNNNFVKFDERISRLAEQYGVDGRYLELEVNEAMLAADSASAANSVKDLQRRGFTITLDDFGSGNESLSMLITAPVNHVKISKNFLKNIGTSRTEQEYVRCMCDMIASVHKEAVFEGVETEEQAEFLRSCGFTTAQGYLFERPIPVSEFEKKYLAKNV